MTTSTHSAPTPELIARGLLVENGKILLCQNVAKGYYYLPGGHVDPGETSSEALAREFQEETGQGVQVGDCLLLAEVLAPGIQELNLVFHVERAGETPPDSPFESQEEHIAFVWHDLAAVPDLDLRPLCLKAWVASGGAVDGPRVGFLSDREA